MQAISAQIDATMTKSARRTPSFRRGSKRYSITGLAADVAAMLGGKPGLERRSTQSSLAQIDEQNGQPNTEIPRDIPTPARSDATPSSRMSYAGSIRSLESKSEDADDIRAREEMDRINAEIMAEMEAERAGTPPKRTEAPRSLHRASSMSISNASIRSSISPSNASIRSSKLEDPEDVRAREEMARINAEIMAAAAAEQQEQRLSRQVYTPPSRPVNSHQRRPTWFDQAKLAVVHGAHGVLKFKKEGADMEIVQSPTEMEPPQSQEQSIRSLEPYVYNGPQHARLPTWVDQATLPIVSGTHGTLKFNSTGVNMNVVEARRSVDAPARPQESKWDRATFVYTGLKHARLPTWADQSKLDIVCGSWGKLSFRDGGADMLVVDTPTPNPASAWADQSTLPVVQGTHCMLNFNDTGADMEVIQPTIIPEAAWFGKRASLTSPLNAKNRGVVSSYITSTMPGIAKAREQEIKQQRLSVVNGLGSATMNHGRDITRSLAENTAEKIVIAEVGGEKYDLNHPALKEIVQAATAPSSANMYWGAEQSILPRVRGSHGFLTFDGMGAVMGVVKRDAYWVDQSTLSILRGDHAFLFFGEFETVMKAKKRDPYWADQSTLSTLSGSHGRLAFGLDGEAKMEVVRPNPYWVDQSTLSLLRGSHGRLAFTSNATSSLEIVRPDPYWSVDQKTISLVRGDHGKLVFGPDGASLRLIRPDPYWIDQRTLILVKGEHGSLVFGSNGASLKAVRPDQYWIDQSTLSLVQGSHGRLSFGPDGASLKIVRPDPYWSSDQRALLVVKASHGRLAFTPNGASLKVVRPDPYWSADQMKLDTVTGTHGMLKFTADEATTEVSLSNRTYWSVNQASLKVVRGSHGTLRFDVSGSRMEVSRSNQKYWAANQAVLKILRGSHGNLRFMSEGATVIVVGGKRPYWEADQASLEVVRGSHGRLHFADDGAKVDVVKSKNRYWVADQRSLKIVWGSHARLHFTSEEATVDAVIPSSLYWDADQKSLRIIQGSHGGLHFTDEEAIIHAAQRRTAYWTANQAILPIIRGSHGMMTFSNIGAAIEVKIQPTPYWTSDQAKLDEIRGSHGVLRLTTEGAVIQLHSHADDKPTPRDPFVTQAAYWADQAKLEKIQGNHARLSFNNSVSSSVPQTTPPDSWNSPPNLETGDFFPDSDSEAEEDRPILSKRTSFGPGAFASILNRVKDRVPIVTNLVGNGSYSSFSHDDESPITPTDSTPSTLDNSQSIEEPVIHTSPESSHHRHHQSAHFEDNPVSAIYGEEQREVKLSPLPTQLEFQFDPVYGQPISIAPRSNSPLLNRAPISTKPYESVRGLASNNPFRSAIPVRRASVTARSDRNEGMIERRKALFEKGGGK